MQGPDRAGEERLSPVERRRRVRRAALLRPMSLLMVAIGAFAFAITLVWWIPILTLATYAALVFLAIRDPLFQMRVIEGRLATRPVDLEKVSPERRARGLPRGETRRKVEEALVIHRRTMFAIEESDDVARALLNDAVPKLHRLVERLVDIALIREKVAAELQKLKARVTEGRTTATEELEKELHTVDVELSGALAKLSTLRARVVRVSLESGDAAQDAAARLNADLDELNLSLEALNSTLSPE